MYSHPKDQANKSKTFSLGSLGELRFEFNNVNKHQQSFERMCHGGSWTGDDPNEKNFKC